MRAVCYARVSSSAQRERDTIASQLRVLPEFVKRQGWTLVRPLDMYVDDGHSAASGKLDARRGLAALLKDAAAGAFDVVVVVDVDRLTRSEDITERGQVLGAFQRANVKIASATSGQVLDLTTSIGDLFGALQGFYAAEENRKRSERVRAGKLTAAMRGAKTTGKGPYGLLFTKPDRWTLHPERAPIALEILERCAAGEGCWTIALDLNARGVPGPGGREWHRGRVYDIIKSRWIVGEYTAHVATRTVITVPAIATEELWQAAQRSLHDRRKANLRKTKHVYLLEGLARCGACGGRMLVASKHMSRGKFVVPARYICEHRKNRPMGPERCVAPYQLVDEIDARAWAAICREVLDPELPAELAAERKCIAADRDDHANDAEKSRAHLERLDKVAASHLARFRRGVLTDQDLDTELAAVNRERALVRAQIRHAERAGGQVISAHARLREASASVERMKAGLDKASPEERREIVLTMINQGGVRFVNSRMHVELLVDRPASVESSGGALENAASWSDGAESKLRIRLVA